MKRAVSVNRIFCPCLLDVECGKACPGGREDKAFPNQVAGCCCYMESRALFTAVCDKEILASCLFLECGKSS